MNPMRIFTQRQRSLLAFAGTAALMFGCALTVSAAPQIGYVYPAGGQQGTTFTVEVGGQALRNVDGVRVSGEGVRASVVEYVRPLDNQERRETQRFLRDIVKRRWIADVMQAAEKGDGPALPDHPLLRDLDEKTPAELERLRIRLFDPKKQPNAQIEETVLLEVTVAEDAPPGPHELRLAAPEGLSNPLCFQVGTLPELREQQFTGGPSAQIVEPPALLNGQIMPGEIDRIRIQASEGQQMVIRLQARALIPYLADAVPGWFQATLALYDPDGEQVAFTDDYRFDPDPVVICEIPADGVYELEVRDAIYRGREDFVYRIAVGELPFVTRTFPLGGREGAATNASIEGCNLPCEILPLDTAEGCGLRQAAVGDVRSACGQVTYAVDSLPESLEEEPNDASDEAQQFAFPHVINGRIADPGDTDAFSFEGVAGDEIVAEVYARRLDSPLDSVLQLLSPDGERLALNDDYKDPEMGLITHHADSYVRVELPADGTYTVLLSDAQQAGSMAHAYRLHLRPARPDFALRLVPSTINVGPGRSTQVKIHALRKDGFEGPIDVALAEAPEGFTMAGTRIEADEEAVEARVSAPGGAQRQVTPIRVEGSALIDGETVVRPAVPAEDQMQAFLWRFLVPRQELLVAVTGPPSVPAVWQPLVPGVQLANDGPVRIPLGGTALVEVEAPETLPAPAGTDLDAVRFRLSNRPRGVTLRHANVGPEGVTLTLKADPNIAAPGDAAYAIVQAFTEPVDAAEAARSGRVPLGVLPAIPFEVVRP